LKGIILRETTCTVGNISDGISSVCASLLNYEALFCDLDEGKEVQDSKPSNEEALAWERNEIFYPVRPFVKI
jgi:hypothetical protein